MPRLNYTLICAIVPLFGCSTEYTLERATTPSPLPAKKETTPLLFNGDLPADASNLTSINIRIESADQSGAKYYRHALLAGDVDCAKAKYSDWVPLTEKFFLDFEKTPDGQKTLCIEGKDGQDRVLTPPLRYSWWKDTVPPSAPQDIVASYGNGPGVIQLQWDYQDDANFESTDSLLIARQPGSQAPTGCEPDNIVDTLSPSIQEFEDATAAPGSVFSYRLCLSDKAENVNTGPAAEAVRAPLGVYRAFVTSAAFYPVDIAAAGTGMDPLWAADILCTASANAAGMAGEFRALLSNTLLWYADRMPIVGPVYNTESTPRFIGNDIDAVAPDGAGYLITHDENGNDRSGATVWTGSLNSGTAGVNCGGWKVGSGGFGMPGVNGQAGLVGDTLNWLDDGAVGCFATRNLYCVSSFSNGLTSFSVQPGTVDDGDVKVTMELPAQHATYQKIELRRKPGFWSEKRVCDTGGTTINTFTEFSDATIEYTDKTGTAARYTYAACVYDHTGALIDLQTANIRSKGPLTEVFVAAVPDGNLGGLSGADDLCTTTANDAGLPGTWQALLSDSTTNAIDRITISGAVFLLNGNLVTDVGDFWTGTHLLPMNVLVTPATTTSGNGAWTGSAADGTADTFNCNDWTSDDSAVSGRRGDHTSTTGTSWLSDVTDTCEGGNQLYCMQAQLP